jgi:hypothetical protein
MLQAGMTEHGQKAISSHVGALTGSERAYQTALKQAGIIQVDNLSTLFDLARMFGTQPLPKGPNLAIITNSGGAGILAADGMAGTSLILPRLGRDTSSRLAEILPRHAQTSNLVDIGMEATPVQYAQALAEVLRDRQVQMALVVIAPGLGVDLPAIARELVALPRAEDKGRGGLPHRTGRGHGGEAVPAASRAALLFQSQGGAGQLRGHAALCRVEDQVLSGGGLLPPGQGQGRAFFAGLPGGRQDRTFRLRSAAPAHGLRVELSPDGACPHQQERGQDRQASGLSPWL